MRPSLIYDVLSEDTELHFRGISPDRIIESQSVDTRPFSTGYFITINMEETTISNPAIGRGPRTCTIAVHHPADIDRNYAPLDLILNRVGELLTELEDETGSDGVRVSCVKRGGRSGNLLDEGWNTITRTSTFGVLYNEYAV